MFVVQSSTGVTGVVFFVVVFCFVVVWWCFCGGVFVMMFL